MKPASRQSNGSLPVRTVQGTAELKEVSAANWASSARTCHCSPGRKTKAFILMLSFFKLLPVPENGECFKQYGQQYKRTQKGIGPSKHCRFHSRRPNKLMRHYLTIFHKPGACARSGRARPRSLVRDSILAAFIEAIKSPQPIFSGHLQNVNKPPPTEDEDFRDEGSWTPATVRGRGYGI